MSNLLINGEFDFTSLGPNAKKALADLFYPVGFIMTVRNNNNYSNYCGCVWTKLPADYFLETSTTVSSNINDDKISAGLPNIKGNLGGGDQHKLTSYSPTQNVKVSASGAFSVGYNSHVGGYGSGAGYSVKQDIGFNAHDSNSIYQDNVTTVQPPAIKAVMWQRIG